MWAGLKRKRLLRKLTFRSLIGSRVRIEVSPDPTQVGIEGVFLGETKNTIILKTRRGVKRILKKGIFLTIYVSGDKIIRLPGELLAGRPEDRVKKAYRAGRKR